MWFYVVLKLEAWCAARVVFVRNLVARDAPTGMGVDSLYFVLVAPPAARGAGPGGARGEAVSR